jgi:hypothetical protein
MMLREGRGWLLRGGGGWDGEDFVANVAGGVCCCCDG